MSRANRSFLFTMLVALTVLVGWAAWFELENWRSAREAGQMAVQARAAVLAENAARSLSVADVALRSVRSARQLDLVVDPRPLEQVTAQLKSLKDALPQLQSFGLVDSHGWLYSSTLFPGDTPAGNRPVQVSDRDYYRHFADGGGLDGLFVGDPVWGRQSNNWIVVLSRAILDRDNRYAGVAVASLDLTWYHRQHAHVARQENVNVLLFTRNERIVTAAFAPSRLAAMKLTDEDWTGKKLSELPFFASVPWGDVFTLEKKDKPVSFDTPGDEDVPGTLLREVTDSTGQSTGIIALHTVPGHPLAIAVQRSWDDILAPFYQDLVRDTGLLTVVLVILVGMWGPASRATRDRDRLFDLSPDPVCITDPAGRFLRINPAWTRVLGYSQSELASTSTMDLVHPLDREEARRLQARLMSGEAVQDVAIRYKSHSGLPVWLAWSAVAEGGRIFAIARDMTRRREAEQALQASEERFRDVAEALGEFIWEIDREGRVTFLSERARATLGLTPSDLLGRPLDLCLDTSSRQKLDMAIMRGTPFVIEVVADRAALQGEAFSLASGSLASGSRSAGTPRTPSPDITGNRYLWLRLSGVPVPGNDGTPDGFRGAGVDITESRISRQALADSETRYRSIVNTVIDGIITINEHGIIQSLNPAAETIFGYSARELVGRPVGLLIPATEAEADLQDTGITDILRREAFSRSSGSAAGGQAGSSEIAGQRKDGTTFPLELGISEVYFGTQRFLIGMCRDVSERRRMERMKDEFVSTVSHELRTPLTSIRGSLGLIAGGVVGELPEKARRLVDIAHSNCERLVNLVNDILDIQKIEAGSMVFDMAPLDIGAVLVRAIEENTSLATHFDVALTLTGHEHPVMVLGDFNRLLQVITNLLSNAIKFSPRGEMVLVQLEIRQGQARVSVIDHGPGISDDFRPHVFRKFSQADATDTRSKGGTGLGLSISKVITERHSGHISFDSQPGHGATFIVELPVLPGRSGADSATDNDAGTPAQLPSGLEGHPGQALPPVISTGGPAPDVPAPDRDAGAVTGAGSGQALPDEGQVTEAGRELHAGAQAGDMLPPRVLVVEDDPDVAHLLQLLLAEDGVLSDVAADAASALRMARAREYAAVTVDILLPDIDGLALAQKLRQQDRKPPLPLIVVSAVAQESRRRLDGAALGIIDWIRKPIDEQRLREALWQALPAMHRQPLRHQAAGSLRILHVEDDDELRELTGQLLRPAGTVDGAATLAEARKRISERVWDVVLLDLRLPDGDGSELLPALHDLTPSPHVVVLSGKELAEGDAGRVAAALQKSRVSNQELLATILRVAGLPTGSLPGGTAPPEG